ncbi:PAS domain S-box protein [Rufibacter immobilis]|uniref:PAS domain S-box protein n=1 Tax=Rufibacter immobilis TaxID=1348778 RepID=UPI0035E853F8
MEEPEKQKINFQNFIHLSREMSCAFDAEGTFLFVSNSCQQILGYLPAELIGRKFLEIIYFPDYQKVQSAWEEKFFLGEVVETSYHYLRKDGSLVHLEWVLHWDREERISYCVARERTQLDLTTQKLLAAEARYRALADNGYDMVNIVSTEGEYKFVSDSITRILGYPQEDLLGKTCFEFVHPEDIDFVKHLFYQYLTKINSTIENVPFRFRAANGRWHWLETVVTNQTDNHAIKGVVLKSRDITDRIEAEQKLKESEQRYKSLFEHHPDAVFSLDRTGRIQGVNTSGCQLLQQEENTILHHHFNRFIHPRQQANCRQLFQNSISGTSYYLDTVFLDHRERRIDISLTLIPILVDGQVEGIYGIVRDISVAKETERELQKLSVVASKVKNGIVVTDKHGKFEWVNEAFSQETGFTLEEIKGKYPADVLSGPETEMEVHRRIHQKVSVEKVLVREEILRYNKDGSTTWLHLEFTPILDEAGELKRVVCITTDITEIKVAQQDRIMLTEDLLRQNKDLQQFAYIVSHNLRAPVANILGLVQLLPRNLEHKETAAKIIKNLHGASERLDGVIRDLNQILTIRSQMVELKEPIDLKTELLGVISGIQQQVEACRAAIYTDFSGGKEIFSVRSYVTSILQNLLTNALKYRSPDRPLEINIQTEKEEEYLCFQIKDNGLGINLKKEKDNLFKLYKRFHFHTEGKGLGLHLVKTQMESLGGKISVESTPQVGTTFKLCFPH